MERDGFFYKPTVVADVKQDAEIIQRRSSVRS
jgi:acyl-CoA reductase-like NAD-dependent aldehyde dehydrogenase